MLIKEQTKEDPIELLDEHQPFECWCGDSEPLLPKKYLSWSQLSCWKSNPSRYRSEYFEGGKKLNTNYLSYGKNIASLIENNQHHDLIPDLKTYDTPEHKIKCFIHNVMILSYIDSYNKKESTEVPSGAFREYKTGKIPWNKSRVQKHDQLLFYAVAVKWSTGITPKYCHLDWIETKDVKQQSRGGLTRKSTVSVTGKVKSFKREFDEREITRMERDIVKTAHEISDAYKKFISEI